jgi:hypothetical protein
VAGEFSGYCSLVYGFLVENIYIWGKRQSMKTNLGTKQGAMASLGPMHILPYVSFCVYIYIYTRLFLCVYIYIYILFYFFEVIFQTVKLQKREIYHQKTTDLQEIENTLMIKSV